MKINFLYIIQIYTNPGAVLDQGRDLEVNPPTKALGRGYWGEIPSGRKIVFNLLGF